MAGDWIKIEKATPGKPEIIQISRLCGCSKADAFFAFFKFYAWLDETTATGSVEFLTREDANEIAGLKGFAEALERVQWAEFSTHGALIMNWERHNGQGAKNRVIEAEKKRRQRLEKPPAGKVYPLES